MIKPMTPALKMRTKINIAQEYGLGLNGGKSEHAMASSPNALRRLSGKPAGNHSIASEVSTDTVVSSEMVSKPVHCPLRAAGRSVASHVFLEPSR